MHKLLKQISVAVCFWYEFLDIVSALTLFVGYNMLVVGIGGPQIPCEKIFIIHLGGLHYSVRYQLSQPGNYVIVVKWGDKHIPGSPFNIVAK